MALAPPRKAIKINLEKLNGVAIVGFALSVIEAAISLFLSAYSTIGIAICGLAFSIIGLLISKKTGKGGIGFAIAGIVLSSVALTLGITMLFVNIPQLLGLR